MGKLVGWGAAACYICACVNDPSLLLPGLVLGFVWLFAVGG